MIYALKLLVGVLLACGIAAAVFRRPFRGLLTEGEYRQAWTLVVLATLVSYLCKFPAVFMFMYGALALYGNARLGRGGVGAVGVFLLLAVVAPPIGLDLGGVGGINYLLRIDHFRLLSLVLIPTAVRLASSVSKPNRGSFLVLDLLLVGYQLFRLILNVPFSTTTMLVRILVEAVLDVFVPYYVITRAIQTMADLRFVGAHLGIGLLFAAGVGVEESLLQHNLYSGLQGFYGISWHLTYQLMRGGLLRIQGMTEQPIMMAVTMVFGAGLWYWLRGDALRRPAFLIGFAAFSFALVNTWSRGPWLAGIVLAVMLVLAARLRPSAIRAVLLGLVVIAVLGKASGAEEVLADALTKFFGGADGDGSSIDYRRQLLDTSLALIQQSPWFGVPNYGAQMQSLKQGEGIIDVVNSYLAIMLGMGVVGLALYVLPFLVVINRLIGALGTLARSEAPADGRRFAVAFIAMNLACLFAIFTTSTFGILPLLLLLIVALPAAWLAMPASERDATSPMAVDEPRHALPARYRPFNSGVA